MIGSSWVVSLHSVDQVTEVTDSPPMQSFPRCIIELRLLKRQLNSAESIQCNSTVIVTHVIDLSIQQIQHKSLHSRDRVLED